MNIDKEPEWRQRLAEKEPCLNRGAITWEEGLSHILNDIKATMTQKHNDYGAKNINEFGLKGILVRIWDKVSRLKNILWEHAEIQVLDETLDDTFMDLAGYAIVALMVRRGYWELPFKGEK